MGLFYRRPLCFFAFLFVAFSLLCFFVSIEIGLLLLCVLAVIFFVLGGIYLWKKPKKRIFFFTALISLAVALVSVGYSILSIALPSRSAERYVGEKPVLAEILREEYRSGDYALYSVRLLRIGDEDTKISATLACYSSEPMASMDRVITTAELSIPAQRSRDGALLSATVDKGAPIYLQRTSETIPWQSLLLSPTGIRVLSERCQSALREVMLSSLGEPTGGLASAFFLGDRSALSTTTVRDFNRSGTSHLMAVSGLHFSILFGALDLLLRVLCCPKKGRIAAVTVGSVVFLFLTGFSMSACRAAMMLYALYLNFLLREDNDSITSLFVSLALIVFLSPYAIVDLGLWMSFLATLGLLTLYPILNDRIPRAKGKGKLLTLLLRILREALILVIITAIATLFLLPILWLYFGEFSTVSLMANPVLVPLSNLFLVSIPIWLLCSFVPFLSGIVGACLEFFASTICAVLSFFSQIPSATLSLQYAFCRVLIPLFVLAMIVVLVLRFRRKWLAFLPSVALVVAFSTCFAVVQMFERDPKLIYVSQWGGEEAILISDGDEAALCDLSGGSPWLYRKIATVFSQTTATEIESVILTQYHEAHPSSMSYLLESEVVRTLYLPRPRDAESGKIATELWEIAENAGSEVVVYEGGRIPLTEKISAEIELGTSEADAFAVSFVGAQSRISYVTPQWLEGAGEKKTKERLTQSQTLIVGGHGERPNEAYGTAISEQGALEKVIYPSEKIATCHRLTLSGVERYVVRKKQWSWEFPIP
ncbi:MAG: ComEC/Rec2 family competence protein [Clostridia bacterium]|nr:ComEC/Rec2 family competence protein [Clostridia bacterium]